MNANDQLIQRIREGGMEARPAWLERTKTDMLEAFRTASRKSGPAEPLWRTIMKKRITRYAVAAALVLAALSLTLFDTTVPEAQAIDQAIEAMDGVRTVYFKAEFFKQGPVECWMKYDEAGGPPTHLCLFMTGFPIRKIDSPEGTFAYNEATNRCMETQRDERRKNWYIDFPDFFRQALKAARDRGDVEIATRFDAAFGREMIIVTAKEKHRRVEYVLDPETKRPVRLTTLELTDFMHYFRQTIAVRHMSDIRYNEPMPEDLFAIPADAQRVTNEHDIMVRPGAGMPADGLTSEAACETIVREVAAALNARDWQRVERLLFPFVSPPPEMLGRIPADPEVKLMEILETGTPYEKDGYWYIPVKSREFGGRLKDEQVPVKFYEFDGQRSCMIMWPD